ncbi:hypothetical protein QR680_018713 [Steinernema hermaphroditum]|uniref:NR LBD domain-containing protein n=1 Tax=Steinernema hermaphroditum TaxID=289476 RepID=A0AA39HIT0_9BILA|nr:hypothetical protein QR680_018713 [Steinernema hermaphroditum]
MRAEWLQDKVLKGRAYGEDFSTIYKVQCVLMFEWVERLDDFKAIKNPVDKTLLLREFALRYLLLDNLFHTVDLGFSDRIVLVNNTVIMPGHFPPKASEKVIGELFTWYKDNGAADAATRMGNVLLLLGHIPNHMKNLYEAAFGVMYEWDSFMTNLLKI